MHPLWTLRYLLEACASMGWRDELPLWLFFGLVSLAWQCGYNARAADDEPDESDDDIVGEADASPVTVIMATGHRSAVPAAA